MFDVLILGGTVVDGSGAPNYQADIGIKGESISALGNLAHSEAKRVINAAGLIVSPGFIDTHAHSDGALLWDPQHSNGLRQGITTEILGQDGLSYAPLSQKNYAIYRRYMAGILGEPPEELDMSSVSAFRSHYDKKVSINTAYCVPHGAVRLEALGFEDLPLTDDNLKNAKRMIIEGIEQGAVGFATGLMYFPLSWSDTTEMIELCKAANEAGGVYVTHLRSNHNERSFGGEGGVPEALEIGRKSGIGVHFSHYRTGPGSQGQVAERMELIDKAKSEGVDCTMELYPYPSGCTFALSMLPSHIHIGGPEQALARIKDSSEQKNLVGILNSEGWVHESVVTYSPETPENEGMGLVDLASIDSTSPGQIVCDLLIKNDLKVAFRGAPPDSVAIWRQLSQDTMEFLSRPDYMVGSDAIPVGNMPHPRAYGTFPRILGRLQRQFPILSLEQIVQRMTDNPARRFGIKKRGRIESGYFADIAIFDAERVIDNATYDDPCQPPAGIPYVLVNGQVAVDNERCTGTLAGRAVP
tara:strand:- start:2119 stop:3696 length:1578 start_codon:yes stop_codon:yes gene_type:complete